MLKRVFRKLRFWLFREQDTINERILLSLGRIETRQVHLTQPQSISESEFRIFSQNGEDGVLQYLLSRLEIKNKYFVEFGTQDYRESNTRFLAQKDLWAGTIIDAGEEHLEYLYKRSFLGFDRDITALKAFITRDNINDLLDRAKVPDDLGLLSVDIDGNDYWVLEAITQGRLKPAILVTEYNSLFGSQLCLSVPYDPAFERFKAHASGLYWGASLPALARLATAWGYALVHCESRGANAFFVRRELLGSLKELNVAEAFVRCQIPAPGGEPELRQRIASLPLVDTASGESRHYGSWFAD